MGRRHEVLAEDKKDGKDKKARFLLSFDELIRVYLVVAFQINSQGSSPFCLSARFDPLQIRRITGYGRNPGGGCLVKVKGPEGRVGR